MEIINLHTTVAKDGWPEGYTCVHLACDGSDANRLRPQLVARLIEAKGDVNSTTLNKKANTPALLANGQGAKDISDVCLAAGGDKKAKNSLGKGMLEMTRKCSSTATGALIDAQVPETYSEKSGRTRTSNAAPSRQDRIARAQASWGYGYQPSDQRNWQSSSSSSWNQRNAYYGGYGRSSDRSSGRR